MAGDQNNPARGSPNDLIWIDMEMTGLQPDGDRIIELAMVITDPQLQVLAESPVWAVHQPGEVLDAMDNWNKSTHGKSGLIERVRASTLTEAEVEKMALEFLNSRIPPGVSPMCGNSICQDRRFLARWMPALERHFHYRNLDVSTLKEIVRRWKPEIAKGFSKEGKHQALADIYDSLEELKYYRKTVFSI